MPITAQDVRNTQFKVTFRGYDIPSVDAFLDDVESELTRLHGGGIGAVLPAEAHAPVHADAAAGNGVASNGAATHNGDAELPAQRAKVEESAQLAEGRTNGRARHTDADPVVAPAAVAPAGGEDVATRAVRTLRLAEQMADQLLAGAGAEADQLKAEATETATRVTSEANAQATELLENARGESDALLTAALTESTTTLSAAKAEATALLTAARTEAEAAQTEARTARETLEAELAARRDDALRALAKDSADLKAEIARLADVERSTRRGLQAVLDEHQALLAGPAVQDSQD